MIIKIWPILGHFILLVHAQNYHKEPLWACHHIQPSIWSVFFSFTWCPSDSYVIDYFYRPWFQYRWRHWSRRLNYKEFLWVFEVFQPDPHFSLISLLWSLLRIWTLEYFCHFSIFQFLLLFLFLISMFCFLILS